MDIQSLKSDVKSAPAGVVLHMADGSDITIDGPDFIAFGPLWSVCDGMVASEQPRSTVFVYWLPDRSGPYLGNVLLVQSVRPRSAAA